MGTNVTTQLGFSTAIYSRVSPLTKDTMQTVERMQARAYGVVAKLDQKFDLKPARDPRRLHNMYVDAIFASSMLKWCLLNATIIESVNNYRFLSYAMAGRSLIEITATLKYFLDQQIVPLVSKCVASGWTTNDDLKLLIEIEDRILRGGRFDWLSFLSKRFDGLKSEFENKRQKGGDTRSFQAPTGTPKQINVLTCLEKWAKSGSFVGVLYELFSDMVHPNVGSTLCIAVPIENGLAFSVDQSESTGLQLFDKSFPLLQAIVGREFPGIVARYLHLKMPLDE